MQKIKHTIIKTLYGDEGVLKHEIKTFVKNRALKEVENYYCIITAVYNVEKYLDNYFQSITNQTLAFKKYIYIILVDDGSTDDSLNIIKKWKEKFNQNISYISCENSGQATARNLALKYAKAPWITFIDADDTINDIYFECVNEFLNKNENIDMISCNQIFHIEQNNTKKNHYLSYRFRKEQVIVNPTHMQSFIQTTASSVFFKHELLNKHNLYFEKKVKPVFEDGHFVNRLLIKETDMNIAFLQKPIYFYTKRDDNSSTVDTGWGEITRYNDALKFGLLDLLKTDNSLFVQRFVLYQVYWYFKKIIQNPKIVYFLNENQLCTFKKILKEIFTYIDEQTIETCGLGGMRHKYRIGFYKFYKRSNLFKQVCYIDEYNYEHKELKVHYYFHTTNKEKILLNNIEITANKYEIIEHKFLDDIFVYEKVLYLPISGKWKYLDIELCDIETQISFNKKRYKNGIQLLELIKQGF